VGVAGASTPGYDTRGSGPAGRAGNRGGAGSSGEALEASRSERSAAAPRCRLCGGEGPFTEIAGPLARRYRLCPCCRLIFVDDETLLDPQEERARYELHQNSPEQSGYVRFLSRAMEPALGYLRRGARALDFGCGPGPTLSTLLGRHGIRCEDYDPFFVPHLPDGSFDAIFATEVLEHLSRPMRELRLMRERVAAGGLLVVMTELWRDDEALGPEGLNRWHYAFDETHVCFYHEETIRWICRQLELELLELREGRVALMRAPR